MKMPTKNWKYFILSDTAGKWIDVFKSIFLSIYFLKITNGNIADVSIYYIATYMAYLLCLIMVNRFKRISLTNMYRIGILLNLAQCLFLLIAGEHVTQLIVPFAIFCGIGNAFYYYPEQLLIKRVNSDSNFLNYLTKDQALKYTISIVFPIILGLCISMDSYNLAFLILSILTGIGFIFSLFLTDVNVSHEKINLRRFFRNVKKSGDGRLLKLLSLRVVFRGLSSFGVLATLITIMTYLVVHTEFSLGGISSIMTLISILVVWYINKRTNMKRMARIFLPLAIIQCVIIAGLTFSILNFPVDNQLNLGPISLSLGLLLILIYNVTISISNPVLETANSVIYYRCMARKSVSIKDQPSYLFWFEIIINLSRSLGYLILLIISALGFNLNIIAIIIAGLAIMYIAFAYTLRKITLMIESQKEPVLK